MFSLSESGARDGTFTGRLRVIYAFLSPDRKSGSQCECVVPSGSEAYAKIYCSGWCAITAATLVFVGE